MKNNAIKTQLGTLKTTDELRTDLEEQQKRFGLSSTAETARVAISFGIEVLKRLQVNEAVEEVSL